MFITNLLKGGRYLLISGALLFFFSCSNDDEELPVIDEGVLESVVSSETVTMDQLLDRAVEEYDVAPEMIAQYADKIALLRTMTVDMTAYTVRYHTVTPDGQPTVASGVVYYPNIKNPKGVMETSPINKSKKNCASRSVRTIECVGSLFGYVSILPDLIGCGTTDEMPISYMQHESAARVSADLRRAAAELIRKKYNKTISNKSIVAGYSLGGAISWALARYYAKHPELGVDVKEVYIGGGAYDPLVAMNAFISTRYSQYAILPNIVYSMNYYDNLELDFNEIFRGELLEHYNEWCTGWISVPELTKMLGYDIGEYMNLEFLSQDNPAMQRLLKAVATKAVPNDWIPTAKVHMYSAKDDTYVPSQCSDQLYNFLKSVGADVNYARLDGNHTTTGFTLGFEVLERLIFSPAP